MTTRRVAAVDCGTNSIRLLIADLDTERMIATDIARQMKIVRLGEGVDRTGRLSAAAIDRTIAALEEYADLIRSAAPESVRMIATSATRDAANSDEFTRRVRRVLGADPEVVSGDEEAALSFAGATLELEGHDGAPFLVTDIGGGSTEFVISPPPAAPPSVSALHSRHISVNIGCVRITERHLHGDPPAPAEIAAATADIDAALETVAATVPAYPAAPAAPAAAAQPSGQVAGTLPAQPADPATDAKTLVGLAGSVTTVAGIALGLDRYDSARIHHSRVPAARVHEIARALLTQTREQRAAIVVMHPGRVDVIGAGALILDRIMTRFGFAEILVSEHDILDGIAWSLVR